MKKAILLYAPTENLRFRLSRKKEILQPLQNRVLVLETEIRQIESEILSRGEVVFESYKKEGDNHLTVRRDG